MTVRQFLQTAGTARNSVKELLQLIFVAELIAPSRCLWVVSAWLRDIPVIDNSAGSVASLAPDLPRDDVRLSRILVELINRGTHVVIATRPGDPANRHVNDVVLSNLPGRASALTFVERPTLHVKGLLGDRFALSGSMNLTFNGVDNLNEMLAFQTDRREIDGLRLMFRNEYGGLL